MLYGTLILFARSKINLSQGIPVYIKDFLSVVGGASGSYNTNDATEDKEDSVIFESNFDWSEERLRYVFDKFDTDKDGKISCDVLMKGLEIQAGLHASLTDDDFNQLAAFLDQGNSGDVSF